MTVVIIIDENDKCECGAYWQSNGFCCNGHPKKISGDAELEELIRVGRLRDALKDEMREIARDEIRKSQEQPTVKPKPAGRLYPTEDGTICPKCGKKILHIGPNGEGTLDYSNTLRAGRMCRCKGDRWINADGTVGHEKP